MRQTNCDLCGRTARTTKHHLVPRSRKRHEEEGYGPKADLCRDCHRKIHATWDNKALARERNTVESLRAAPELQTYFRWIRRRPACTYFGSRDSNV